MGCRLSRRGDGFGVALLGEGMERGVGLCCCFHCLGLRLDFVVVGEFSWRVLVFEKPGPRKAETHVASS